MKESDKNQKNNVTGTGDSQESKTHLRFGRILAVIIVIVICIILLAAVAVVYRIKPASSDDQQNTAEEAMISIENEETQNNITPSADRINEPDDADDADDTEEDSQEEEPVEYATQEEADYAALSAIWENDPRQAVEARGVYMTAYAAGNPAIRNSIIELLDETEINAVIINIKDDEGYLSVDMDIPLAEELGSDSHVTFSSMESLESVLNEFKEHGAYIIARIPCFRDQVFAGARPDCALHWNEEYGGDVYVDSQGYRWLDPGNDTVREYLLDISEAAIDMGFDEVQFDYVRFPTSYPGRIETYGGSGYYLEDGVTYNEEAAGFRRETITSFIEYMSSNLIPQGVFVSADVYGTIINSDEDSGNVGQDYSAMSQWLDYICPMVYPSHYSDGAYGIDYPDTKPYELVHAAMNDSVDALSSLTDAGEHCATVRPWMQAFTASWLSHHISYGGAELREQIDAVYDAGYSEWLIWQSSVDYTNFRSGIEDK